MNDPFKTSVPLDEPIETRSEMRQVLDSMSYLLEEKNKRYGNSALKPLKIFSKKEAGEGILVRLDDKLGRIRNSEDLRKNDVADIIGYLTLLCVSQGWLDFNDLID